MCSKKRAGGLPKGKACFVVHKDGSKEVMVVERLVRGVHYCSLGGTPPGEAPRIYKVLPVHTGKNSVEYLLVEE